MSLPLLKLLNKYIDRSPLSHLRIYERKADMDWKFWPDTNAINKVPVPMKCSLLIINICYVRLVALNASRAAINRSWLSV